ncbi:LysM peptidoglycan-binding domain-containing protein [Cyanobium sp. NIES-981]|uniref:LysM peptidoglycan-binding domain-containing protein n=1 Tax=Cyanobium sp. NIES-981 TaxID=1851505 RepID=UPI0007DCE696|nr:LysM peptidoglycan-binding domain-containing protein [Cyanobium sp. NIES-981]SBO43452.1 Alginate regulatory protein AlgP [Cyanobium sp. NIES-981]
MRRALAALALAVALPLPSLAPTPVHAQVVVRPGETLSEIAERHGVSLSRLMQANGITNPDLVVVGQNLVIPGGVARSNGSRTASGSVTVKPGETLSEIAEREGVSMSQLMQANGLGNADLVMVGQRLAVPGRSRSSAAAGSPARATPTAPYTVQSGETLSDIAARFGTTPERLIQINALSNPDLVLAGSRLRIPSRPGGTAAPARSAASATAHVVSPGESLGSIADRYGTTVDRLVALNGLENPDLLHAGTRLKLVGTPPAKTTAQPAPKTTAQPASKTAAQTAPKPEPKPAPKPVPAAAAQAAPAPAATPTSTPQPSSTTTAAATRPEATRAAVAQAPADRDAEKPAPSAERTPTAAAATQPAQPAPSAAATQTSAEPEPKPEPKAAPKPEPRPSRLTLATRGLGQTTPRGTVRAATPAVAGTAAGVTTVASRTIGKPTATAAATSASPASGATDGNHDWRSYGPLQVDWANWQPMGGSYVAPTLNSEGEPLYLAINCGARKVNATGQSGQWKTWDDPQRDYEQKLVSDLCKAKGG